MRVVESVSYGIHTPAKLGYHVTLDSSLRPNTGGVKRGKVKLVSDQPTASVSWQPRLSDRRRRAKSQPHLLYNSKDSTLLGDLSGSTMIATFTVSGVNEGATFTWSGTCGSTPATVRIFFESIPPGTKFAYTNYWWADVSPASAVLANGDFTLTATVDATQAWSDWNGQPSSANAGAFNAAATNPTAVGLSFGGGCFFENGVGTSDGSGTLTLDTFNVSS
jgi:hypothetical protein